ncbi:MAG: DUF4376 domain-containing protein [Prevotella sp.]|nr:DUF4376 domain-containing protein [Prevotella sp.]
MYKLQFDTRHKLGIERLSGDNSGRLFANEKMESVVDDETGEMRAVWSYDVYEIADARDPKAAKDAVISEAYPNGAEQKLLRQAVAKILKALGSYDTQDYADFKQYNELCEAIATDPIRGNGNAPAPTQDEVLAKAKAEKINEIAEFDASANVNAFTVNGVPMWLNFDQRSRLRASVNACTEPTMTKYFGGVAFTYPVEVWKQMLNSVELYADTCQTITEAHKAAVYQLQTLQEVEDFDITADYPAHPDF